MPLRGPFPRRDQRPSLRVVEAGQPYDELEQLTALVAVWVPNTRITAPRRRSLRIAL
jgi:hypothetical protein